MPNSTLCVKSQRNCKGLHLNLLFIVAGAFLLNDCYNDVFEFLLQYNGVAFDLAQNCYFCSCLRKFDGRNVLFKLFYYFFLK